MCWNAMMSLCHLIKCIFGKRSAWKQIGWVCVGTWIVCVVISGGIQSTTRSILKIFKTLHQSIPNVSYVQDIAQLSRSCFDQENSWIFIEPLIFFDASINPIYSNRTHLISLEVYRGLSYWRAYVALLPDLDFCLRFLAQSPRLVS